MHRWVDAHRSPGLRLPDDVGSRLGYTADDGRDPRRADDVAATCNSGLPARRPSPVSRGKCRRWHFGRSRCKGSRSEHQARQGSLSVSCVKPDCDYFLNDTLTNPPLDTFIATCCDGSRGRKADQCMHNARRSSTSRRVLRQRATASPATMRSPTREGKGFPLADLRRRGDKSTVWRRRALTAAGRAARDSWHECDRTWAPDHRLPGPDRAPAAGRTASHPRFSQTHTRLHVRTETCIERRQVCWPATWRWPLCNENAKQRETHAIKGSHRMNTRHYAHLFLVLLISTASLAAEPREEPAAERWSPYTLFRKPPRAATMVVDGFLWIEAEDFCRLRRLAAGYPVRPADGIGLPDRRRRGAAHRRCRDRSAGSARDGIGCGCEPGTGSASTRRASSRSRSTASARRTCLAPPTAKPGSGNRPASSI